ncbi:MAG: hypothetical protein AAFW87_06220 [Pseudomonadota bacterium]
MPRAARIVLAITVFWAFLWLSPQVYYFYYMLIIDSLPWQIVIKAPPGAGDLVRLMSFSDDASLSAHGQGALGWAMVAAAVFKAPVL